MDGYLAKPVRGAELLQVIGSLLSLTTGQLQPNNSAAEDDLGVFDRAALLRRLEGDSALLDEVLQIFLDDTPSILEKLRRAAAERDLKALLFSAHALKGSAANLCASRIQAAAAKLEIMAKEDRLGDVEAQVSAIEVEMDSFSRLFSVKP